MHREFFRLQSILPVIIVFLSIVYGARAQGPKPFPDAEAGVAAMNLVSDFYRYGSSPVGIHPDSIERYAIDWFSEYLAERGQQSFWPAGVRYSVDNVFKIYSTDSAAMVTARTWPDSLPYFGPLTIDWTWFLRRNPEGEWRIAYVRRTDGLDKALEMLHLLDTTDMFPDRIKPDIAREHSTILLSNEQIRAEFNANRVSFDSLVALVATHDSIRFVERTGDRISQFNLVMINWGLASEDVPQEVIDEYLATASAEEREAMEARLRTAENQKREGETALQGFERRARLKAGTLAKVGALMKTTRVRFINAELQWRDAILLTLGGNVNDAVGFLYSPEGELPLISPEEFFYLEDLGDGWWIYRAT